MQIPNHKYLPKNSILLKNTWCPLGVKVALVLASKNLKALLALSLITWCNFILNNPQTGWQIFQLTKLRVLKKNPTNDYGSKKTLLISLQFWFPSILSFNDGLLEWTLNIKKVVLTLINP